MKYRPIWDKLKETGHCKVSVPIPLQRRVIKGVINQKYEDKGFKFLHYAELRYKKTGSQIEFWLVYFDERFKVITLKDLYEFDLASNKL